MSDKRVFLRGLFVAGLVAALCTYGLAAGQAANRNRGVGTDQNQPGNANRSVTTDQNEPGNGNRSATAQPGARTPASQMAPSAQGMTLRTSQWIGKQVKGAQSENLGVIHDIVLTPDYQQVSYVALSYGGVSGPGSKLYAVPWQALHVGANGDVTTSITKDQLSQSPGFTSSYWPSQADTSLLSASAGSTSSATAGGQAAAGGSQAGPSSSPAAGQTAMGGQDVQMRRVTHLTGTEVKNTQNQDLGDIEDFVVDTSSGHITFDVISVGGVAGSEKYAAVPSNAVQIQPQTHTAILNTTKQTLDSVAFSPSQFPNLSSPDYMAQVSKLFPAAPSGGALGYVPSQTPQTQLIANQRSWSAEGPHGKAFNPGTVKTITGTVESVGSFKPESAPAGVSPGLRLRVKTSDGKTVTVYAGPSSYAEQNNFFVMPGDQISITGSQTTIRSRSVVLASELKKGSQTLELRDKTGKPLWTMGQPSSAPSGTGTR
jgi:sporulation protein YlmC with PRC-barrel domain